MIGIKIMKKLLPLIALLTLSGCGSIDNAVRSNESIQEKTAFALGTMPENIEITNRSGDITTVRFYADYNKRKFQCYYMSAYGLATDVVCSPTDGKPLVATQQCNELLKAAGKC